jgi:hypothetical protein
LQPGLLFQRSSFFIWEDIPLINSIHEISRRVWVSHVLYPLQSRHPLNTQLKKEVRRGYSNCILFTSTITIHSPTNVTKLIFTSTCHMIASLFTLNK